MQIQLFATYRDLVNAKVVDIPVPDLLTVKQLLQSLINHYPDFQDELFVDKTQEQLKPHVNIFVNGRNIIYLHGLDTLISTKDEIALFPPVGGG
ncbi:ubiquitin-like small modifier protein 1 [Tepidibacillus sp. LV47]|uniref:ubiquitin-like small modifier protein 1 n=1 Tax=Tepidibacillus sp. LV47 TaxID=3398228 RepID=UPI003AAC26B7